MSSRVGLGFDVHPFSEDRHRPLRLGGVTRPGERGLAGHSDADVVAHAVADALLGAAGQGDLGQLYPDDDPAWAGVDSLRLLAGAVERIRAAGWRPVNVDCAVVLEAPRLAPHRTVMEDRLSEVVGADVTVGAKRPEGMGALGRGEGVACWAVALVERDGGG
jgi:2-C-methyl-D-erythritol 2,4-cyclodiphosphate synthase